MALKYKHSIFLVDDEESILRSLQRLFRKEGYEILTSTNGSEGLELLKKQVKPISLFISDQRMPEMTGSEFLHEAKKLFPNAMRFLLTGYSSMEAIVDAVNKGSIHRYINKPWDDNDLLFQVRQALEQYEMILENKRLLALTRKQNKELNNLNKSLEQIIEDRTKEILRKNQTLSGLNADLESSLHNTVRSFVSLTELSAPYLAGHGRRVSHLAREIALQLDLSEKEITTIEIAALLHDLGKLGLPQKLISQKHEKWTTEEEALFRKHPEEGQGIVRFIKNLDHVGLLIRSHHEWFDGKGYPDKLSEEMIPLGSRIIAVADAWDKITELKENSQSFINEYLKGQEMTQDDMTHEELLAHAAVYDLKKNAFVKYDPDIIKVFLSLEKAKGIKERGREKVVPITALEEGMVLAMSLYTARGRFLLPHKTVLTKEHITKFKGIHNVDPLPDAIYIENEGQVK
jgi:response regulator RpfG family c-di-GMP phosphodiesterase